MTAPDRVHTMSSFFRSADHQPVTPSVFAPRMLDVARSLIMRQYTAVGVIEKDALAILDVRLGDPANPIGRPIPAYINASAWKARCECGGIELVDDVDPVFMCCSCWNGADGHAWRPVRWPRPAIRAAIERVILARPTHRAWNPDETVADLVFQNREHKLADGINANELAAAAVAEVVVDA